MVTKMKNKMIDRLINEPMPLHYVVLFAVFIITMGVMFVALPIAFGEIDNSYIEEYGSEVPTNDWCVFWFEVAEAAWFAMIVYLAIAIIVEVLSLRKEAFDASDVMCGLSWYLNSRKGEYCAFLETDPPGDKSKLTLNSMAEIDSVLSEIERMRKIIEEG
jgi:hypothetical protein